MRNWASKAMILATLTAWASWATGLEDPPKKLTDAEITKLLVGIWAVEEEGGNGFKIKGTDHYKKDGTIVAATGTFYLQAGAFPGSPIRGA